MSTIIAGHFDHIEQAQSAADTLAQRGFQVGEYCLFYLSPSGQRGLLSWGGDAYADEGAREAGSGGILGTVVGGFSGAAVGLASGLFLPNVFWLATLIVATGIGAYVGSLIGAMSRTHPPSEAEASVDTPAERPAGPVVAACADRPGSADIAIEVLDASGAREIERAHGAWRSGAWVDFDPRQPTETVTRHPNTPAARPERCA